MSEIKTDTVDRLVEQAAREYSERVEREIIGAWRAGYDYLHVGHPLQADREYGFRFYAIPTDSPSTPMPERATWTRYDVGDVTDELIAEVMADE